MADTNSDAQAPARESAGSKLAAKRAAKAAKKAAARGTQDPVDEVKQSMASATTWFDQHRNTIVIGVSVIAIATAGYLAVSAHTAGIDNDAGSLLHAAVTTSQGYVTSGAEPAPEDLLVPTFASVSERETKALEQFRAVPKKFPDAPAARWAKLGEANTLLGQGKHAEAAKVYGVVRDGAGDDTYLRVRALEGLGYALEADKKPADALARFEELSRFDNGAYKILGDYHRARILAAMGKQDEAVKVLEALLKAGADKPSDAGESERLASITEHARTLLTELGGKAPDKPGADLGTIGAAAGGGNDAITQQVLDALRKQMADKKQGTGGK